MFSYTFLVSVALSHGAAIIARAVNLNSLGSTSFGAC
jgi:hypothetical protein